MTDSNRAHTNTGFLMVETSYQVQYSYRYRVEYKYLYLILHE